MASSDRRYCSTRIFTFILMKLLEVMIEAVYVSIHAEKMVWLVCSQEGDHMM